MAHVPFWARFPFEVRVTSTTHVSPFADVDEAGRDDLAEVLAAVLSGLDGLFGFSMPYVMGVFAEPTGGDPASAAGRGAGATSAT